MSECEHNYTHSIADEYKCLYCGDVKESFEVIQYYKEWCDKYTTESANVAAKNLELKSELDKAKASRNKESLEKNKLQCAVIELTDELEELKASRNADIKQGILDAVNNYKKNNAVVSDESNITEIQWHCSYKVVEERYMCEWLINHANSLDKE